MTARSAAGRAMVVVAVLLVCAGGAVAYWQADGSGGGQVSALATATDISVSPSTPAQALLPGGSGDVAATLVNPNPFAVRVSRIALDAASGNAGWSANASGCALAFTTQTTGWTIPANGTLDVVLSGAVSMGAGAVSSCQGRAFTVYLSAS